MSVDLNLPGGRNLGGPWWLPAFADHMRLTGKLKKGEVLVVVYGNKLLGTSASPVGKLKDFRMIRRAAHKGEMQLRYFAANKAAFNLDD